MGWNPDYIYRIRGCWHHRDDEEIIVFDLDQSEIIITCDTAISRTETEPQINSKKRLVTFPEDWGTSFGVPFYEYHLRNQTIELGSSACWNANMKCMPVPTNSKFDLLTPDELENTISHLRNS